MKQPKPLVFSTGNADKFAMAQAACSRHGITLEQRDLPIDEIQGEDLERIAIDKADKAFAIARQPLVANDDCWLIPGLNGFPGPYMKSMNEWFTPEDFLRLTKDLADRRIILRSFVVYRDATRTKVFTRDTEGELLTEIRGQGGPSNTKIICMSGDNGLSIAEVHDKNMIQSDRPVLRIWDDVVKWYLNLA